MKRMRNQTSYETVNSCPSRFSNLCEIRQDHRCTGSLSLPGARARVSAARRTLCLPCWSSLPGVCILTIQSRNRTAEYLATAALTVVVFWDLVIRH